TRPTICWAACFGGCPDHSAAPEWTPSTSARTQTSRPVQQQHSQTGKPYENISDVRCENRNELDMVVRPSVGARASPKTKQVAHGASLPRPREWSTSSSILAGGPASDSRWLPQ